MSECIDRQAAIEAAKHAWAKGLDMMSLPTSIIALTVAQRWIWRANHD